MNYRVGIRINVGNNRWFEFGGQVISEPTITRQEIAENLYWMEIQFNALNQNKRMHTSLEEERR